MRLGRGVLPLLLACTSGCFSYVRSEVQAVPVGERVRLHLSADGMTELRDLSSDAEPVVTGTLMRREAGEVVLRISEGGAYPYAAPLGQDVRIPVGGIVQLEQRRLDPLRTGLMAGGSVALGAAVLLSIIDDAFGNELPPTSGDPQLRIPIGWLRFP